MSIEWVRIRSWHALRVSRLIVPRTLCGRQTQADDARSDTLPSGKSCESCLRIVARLADA